MKTCKRCNQVRPLSDFTKHAKTPYCKPCCAEKLREWREANPELSRAHSAKYKERHPDKIKQISKQYCDNNKDVLAIKNREWYERNTEYAKQKAKEWRLANPERVRATLNALRMKRNSAAGSFTAEDVKNILSAQLGLCSTCGVDLAAGYHIDHIVPLSKGGTSWPDNLQMLCPTCNRRKGRKMPEQWAELATLAKTTAPKAQAEG